MNVNKKFDRFKQWAGERMGGEVKTQVSDDFKALEQEMSMRHEGMERMQKSMTAYIKAVSKRNEGDDKEKSLAVGHLGGTMVHHGENLEYNSEFGQCLINFGRTQERIARIQEQYIANATSSWLESLDRSLAQMKEYQVARKKLETRRLAYDTSLAKMQKAKREDFRAEEELRSQKVKFEEASDDIFRRMQDIRNSEADSLADLTAFLEAELSYHDKCREVLLQLKNNWPVECQQPGSSSRRPGRARSNTAHSYHERYEPVPEVPSDGSPERRPVISSNRTASVYQVDLFPAKDVHSETFQRPFFNRTPTFEGPTQLRREQSPSGSLGTNNRFVSDSAASLRHARSQLRTVSNADTYLTQNGNDNDSAALYRKASPERTVCSGDGYATPATPPRNGLSRAPSSASLNGGALAAKKAPPPPPPPRAKKPPPPPPPSRRNLATSLEL
ncbi:hypothetical protein VTO42DRAFT_5668 [Malbranchea cinnamomea]